jgi:hypothetical protein
MTRHTQIRHSRAPGPMTIHRRSAAQIDASLCQEVGLTFLAVCDAVFFCRRGLGRRGGGRSGSGLAGELVSGV